jgi:hypothetical protein
MLIEMIVGAVALLFIKCTFGLSSAESDPVGVGLFRRLFPFAAFPESLQVNDIRHGCPHHPVMQGHAAFSRRREQSRRVLACSVVIQGNPRGHYLDSIKEYVSPCENKIFCAVPRGRAAAIAERPQSLAVMSHNYIGGSYARSRAEVTPGASFCSAEPSDRIQRRRPIQAAPLLLSRWFRLREQTLRTLAALS